MKRKFYMLFSALLIFSLYACTLSDVEFQQKIKEYVDTTPEKELKIGFQIIGDETIPRQEERIEGKRLLLKGEEAHKLCDCILSDRFRLKRESEKTKCASNISLFLSGIDMEIGIVEGGETVFYTNEKGGLEEYKVFGGKKWYGEILDILHVCAAYKEYVNTHPTD